MDVETAGGIYLRYIKTDEEKDLESLLRICRDGLFLFLLGYVKNEEDAEELLMDTFARLAVDKPRFTRGNKGSFRSWLYAIARNNALMHIRRRKMEASELSEDLASDDETPESALLKDERDRKLYSAMERLTPEYRRALVLLYFEGLSHDEIALAMGLDKKQIYNLLERGKQSLKKILEGMGIDDVCC